MGGRRGSAGRIERALEGAEGEGDGDDDADAGWNQEPREGCPGAFEDRELGDEAAESGQAHRGDRGDGKGERGKRESFCEVQFSEFRDVAGVGAVVEHPSDHGEEKATDDAVREHLENGAAEAREVERHQPEQDEPHVRDARITDGEFKILLREGDERAEDDARSRQHGNQDPPLVETLRKESHGHAQRGVRTELHHDAREQHRYGGRRGDVSGRRPRVQRPEAGQHGEADEHHGKRPRLEGRRKMRLSRIGECEEIERMRSRGGVGGDQREQDERAAGHGIHRQLHRAVFAVCGPPRRDEEVFRDDDDLVEHEEQEEVEALEDPVNTADDDQVKCEERPRTVRDIPRKQHAGHRDDSGEQEQDHADAVCPGRKRNPELRHPRNPRQKLEMRGTG